MKPTPRPTKTYTYSWTDSPIGRLRLVASKGRPPLSSGNPPTPPASH